jgi:prophage regulatory protein
MSPAKKQKRRKPTAAERARAAFDPDPASPIDAAAPPPSERVVVEQARPPPRLLSKAEVLALVPVSYPCLWAMMVRGEFPRARRLSPNSNRVAWLADEVSAWIESRPVQKLKDNERATGDAIT